MFFADERNEGIVCLLLKKRFWIDVGNDVVGEGEFPDKSHFLLGFGTKFAVGCKVVFKLPVCQELGGYFVWKAGWEGDF